jgi:outer membrane protein OmpA-like peptidoglycan-associated protein
MARRILLGMVGLLLLGGAARAQSSNVRDRVDPPAPLAGETYLGPHVGYSFIGKFEQIYCPCDTDQNDFLFAGGRLGHFFTDHLALEATGQYFNPDRARLNDFWELTFGGLYDFTPSLHGWNTYVGFGGGASRQDVFKGKGVALAYLAAGSEYRFGKLVGLRLEVKGNYNFNSRFTESVNTNVGTFSHLVGNPSHVDIQPSIGLLIHFGGKAARPVVEAPPAPPPPAPAPPAAAREPERPAAPPVAPAPPPPQAPVRDTIAFDHGKARVTNMAKAKLDAVALRLRDNPRATVTIIGYPDAGAGPRQEALARQRAENVKQYLIERHGIDASRLTTKIDMTGTANRTRAVVVTILP